MDGCTGEDPMKPLAPLEKAVEKVLKENGFQKKREFFARVYPAHSVLIAFLIKPSLVGDLTVFSLDTAFNLTNQIPFRRYIDFKANPFLMGGPFHYRLGTLKNPGTTKVDYWYRMGREKDLSRNGLTAGTEEAQMFTGTPELVQEKLLADLHGCLLPLALTGEAEALMEILAFRYFSDPAALNLIFTLGNQGRKTDALRVWEAYQKRKTEERRLLENDSAPLQILEQFDRTFAGEESEVQLLFQPPAG